MYRPQLHPQRWRLPFMGCAALAVIFMLMTSWSLFAGDSETSLKKQRIAFQQAEQALARGKLHKFQNLKKDLQHYPLYPYLEYREFKRQMGRVKTDEILKFINNYAGSPVATRLHYAWLKKLAQQKRWQTLVQNYHFTKNKNLQCHYAYGLLKTGKTEDAYTVAKRLWLTNRSLPKSCDAIIDELRTSNQLSRDLVLKRIRLVMQSGRSRLAQYLTKYLDKEDRHWITLWRKIRNKPTRLSTEKRLEQDLPVVRWILVDGLVRLAKRDPSHAAQQWQTIRDRYSFSEADLQRVEQQLALKLTRDDDAESQYWLKTLDFNTTDDYVLGIYILSAIKDQDWQSALAWLNHLSTVEQHSERWRYWRGRVLEAMGRLDEARGIYLLNAFSRSYYGFLAADRNGIPYRFFNRPVSFSGQELETLKDIPAFLRARELFSINRIVDARREWRYAIQRMNRLQMLMAAQTADDWGWHDQAIFTFTQAQYWHDLDRRFPLAHQDLVLDQAKQYRINPAWAYAIIRQESAFTADARSTAGALGLMQLLPRTARQIARSLQMRFRNRNELLNVKTNVRLGVGYLKKVRDRFHGNRVLATAAYNAGSFRVRQWLPQEAPVSADLWVESIPFAETRDYLKRVLTYTVIYEERLGQKVSTLMEHMSPIQVPTTVTSRSRSFPPPKNIGAKS